MYEEMIREKLLKKLELVGEQVYDVFNEHEMTMSEGILLLCGLLNSTLKDATKKKLIFCITKNGPPLEDLLEQLASAIADSYVKVKVQEIGRNN